MRFESSGVVMGLLGAAVAIAAAAPTRAGVPGGVAMVLGCHVMAVEDSLGVPAPGGPDDLVTAAPAPGVYDVWVLFMARRPMRGAWSLAFSLEFDRRPGRGIDILEWSGMADRIVPDPRWPDGGSDHGLWVAWNRAKCLDPEAGLMRGRDGWYVQPVARLRVRVHGDDQFDLADPEPGVVAEVVECADEGFRLDGVDGWTAWRGARFGAGRVAGADDARTLPVASTSWGGLKARFRESP